MFTLVIRSNALNSHFSISPTLILPKNIVKNELFFFYNNKSKFQRIILEYEIAKHGECSEH